MVREDKLIATNRRASYEYFLSSPIECGIVLTGTEIKSLRKHSCSLQDAYVIIKGHEAFILGMHIAPYEQGTIYNHTETRTRKLLLHKKEILKLESKISQQGYTLIATKVYLSKGRAKVEICLAKGKKLYDKREDLKNKSQQREMLAKQKEYNNR